MKFNVIYRDNSSDMGVSAAYLEGTRRTDIAHVYIIDVNRMATESEIQSLCAGTWKGV